jgi:hypothetical protein
MYKHEINNNLSSLSMVTWERLKLLFHPNDQERVANLLVNECGTNLPCCEATPEDLIERIRFAVMKLSNGNLRELHYAVHVAKIDWRDVLYEAGFADSTTAHLNWIPKQKTNTKET